MPCTCSQYPAPELSRASLKKRLKATPAILTQLVPLAENEAAGIRLLRCPHCAQYWQTGREWNLGNDEYAYPVPTIGVADWQQEPYLQPAAWMIYAAMMAPYYAKNTFEPSDRPCRVAGCPNQAIRFSGVCERHHIEQLQQFGMLPKRPVGRLFPPYSATAPA